MSDAAHPAHRIAALDPLTVPLHGSRLIEASAGTGKTWTIAALYVRLVLGHGTHETGFGEPLLPRDILVMTFTVAATRELVDRIRTRLAEAARFFRDGGTSSNDAFLATLAGQVDDRAIAAHRLANAADAMDDAAVVTIDAWCQRMLREHAFESGGAFDVTLQVDDRPTLRAAVRDWWRQDVYPLRGAPLDDVLAVWKDVDAAYADLEKLLEHDDDDEDERSLSAVLVAIDDEHARHAATAKPRWIGKAREMRAWLAPLLDRGSLNGNKMKRTTVLSWLDALDRWAVSTDRALLVLGRGASRLTRAGVVDAFNSGRTTAVPDVFDDFASLMASIDALPDRNAVIRRHAMRRVRSRLVAIKRRSARYGFRDMLDRLDRALIGPQGAALRDRIVEQYPVALIDEFQDTSPVQYRIFDRLYRIGMNDRATAIFLIGDPKQSIYGFRGADIHSYLRAARAVDGRRYPLTMNHRSTEALVTAVNRLFMRGERRDEGAFRFRANGLDLLPFVETRAHGRDDRLVDRDGEVPALVLAHDATARPQDDARSGIAGHCAERIVALLDDPRAGFESSRPLRSFQRLKAGHIAVIVRDRHEAKAMQDALRARGVASVYLSDSDSIFSTREAKDVLHWLRAVEDPSDARLARIALATASMERTFVELAELNDDDALLERVLSGMRELADIWRLQGVLPMLRAWLHRHGLPARWLDAGDAGDAAIDGGRGERRLTNVLHVAELLQAASAELEGEQALVRWLASHVDAPEMPADEQVVRLESDAGLVQVVTVHKAKGLEYPLVFMPFGCSSKAPRERTFDVVDDGDRRVVTFHVDGDTHKRHRDEQRREELRLFYVAVTRARHALWIGVPTIQAHGKCTFEQSPLGWLVAEGTVEEGAIGRLLDATFADLPQVRIENLVDAAPSTRLASREAQPALAPAVAFDARFERDWTIGSFSAFVRDLERGAPSTTAAPAIVDPAIEEELRIGSVDDEIAEARIGPMQAARHRFPRGAFVGRFLHDQLEWLAARRFAMDRDVAAALVDRCTRQGWGRRADDVVAWMGEVVSTPLPPIGVALDALPRTLPEMEFWLPNHGIDAAVIDEACRASLLVGRDRPALPAQALRGMLMGFADLVFEHDGRYWVLDYKSNALGTRDADYTRDALEAAMTAHRYDVQAAIYLLALHRLLRARLGDRYDPSLHIGGAIDLFLRGIRGPASGCVAIVPPPGFLDTLDASIGEAAALA